MTKLKKREKNESGNQEEKELQKFILKQKRERTKDRAKVTVHNREFSHIQIRLLRRKKSEKGRERKFEDGVAQVLATQVTPEQSCSYQFVCLDRLCE